MLFKMHWCCFLLLIIPMLFCYNRFALSNATGWHLANNLNAKHIETHIYYHIIMVGCLCEVVRLWVCEVSEVVRLWYSVKFWSLLCTNTLMYWWRLVVVLAVHSVILRWGKIASALGSTMNNRFHLQQMILIVMYFLLYFVVLYVLYNRFFLNFFINRFFQV